MPYVYVVSDPSSRNFKFGMSAGADYGRVESYCTVFGGAYDRVVIQCDNPVEVERAPGHRPGLPPRLLRPQGGTRRLCLVCRARGGGEERWNGGLQGKAWKTHEQKVRDQVPQQGRRGWKGVPGGDIQGVTPPPSQKQLLHFYNYTLHVKKKLHTIFFQKKFFFYKIFQYKV